MEPDLYDFFYRTEEAHWWFRARRAVVGSILERVYPEGELEIADVGCGTGGMAPLLARFGRVTGVDESVQAREYCARRGLPRVLGLHEWERAGAHYDLVTAFDVLEHVEDDVNFLKRIRARLRPGGRLLLTVPAHPFLWGPFDEMNHHQRRYLRGSLRRSLVFAGFEVERSTYYNMFLFPPMAVVRLTEKLLRPEPDPSDLRPLLERWFRIGRANGFLEAVMSAERHWLVHRNLPLGSSLLAVGRNHAS